MSPSTVSCSIDLQAPGKQIGHLRINKITNTAGWASTFIHIGCIAQGEGPTVLVLAGNHGDEYEGQVAAMRLLQELQPDQVTGRVIVIPVLSPAASKGNTRNWPSGANFNRAFPGRPDGPPHEQLADYLTRVLFPMADVVIDMHAGGRSAYFLPCSHMHVVDNPAQRKAMLEAMEAWCTDHHYLYIDVNGSGAHPLFKYLKSEKPGLLGTGLIKWNFTKFLVGKDGRVVKRYAPTTSPDAIANDIESLIHREP